MFFPARKVARAVNCSPFGLVVGSMQMMILQISSIGDSAFH